MTKNLQYQINENEYAQVISINHPLVTVRGFSNINPGEMVIFESNQSLGQVLSFSSDKIKLMVFSKNPIKIGEKLYRTNQQLSFPITSNLMGSIFNSVGELLFTSNKNITEFKTIFKEIYQEPKKIEKRKRITQQLITGFSITDLLLPIGEGQRELLIGDRKSGKSNFARNLAVKQVQMGNKIVYAMIAKKTADIKKTYDFFVDQKVMNSITIIASTPKDSISSIVITPYSAMTVAEHIVSTGKNTLLILDDLTSQAEFYREISLLANKFPGRESYPGDIFFSQAQLLERSGTFIHPNDPKKSVSLTCLPIVRTNNSDLTDFISSNLISITDGHLLFDQRLFSQGVRPAVNVGLSVTRVGKQTQTPIQRDINLKITSFLTSYKKTIGLTHLGSEISEKSQEVLKKGELISDFFTENNGLPLDVQIILLSMIWLNWFKNTHKNVVKTCRFELNKQYTSNKKTGQKLKELVNSSNNLSSLLENLKKEKVFLLNLCQV